MLLIIEVGNVISYVMVGVIKVLEVLICNIYKLYVMNWLGFKLLGN